MSAHFNYMRNSVKVVVNAYDGDIDFYVWDTEDPMILTYERIFPDLFKRGSEMPEDMQIARAVPAGLLLRAG